MEKTLNKGQLNATQSSAYTAYLQCRPQTLWKRLVRKLIDPYRLHLRRLRLGHVLDVGCGVGRCLSFVDGDGVGIDHNEHSVALCRQKGLEAYTPPEFQRQHFGAVFDSLLMSHVVEHMSFLEAVDLIKCYVRYLKPDAKIVLITPQEAGFRRDSTHVEFMDLNKLNAIMGALDVRNRTNYSYPFPRWVGRYFVHNEFVATATLPK